jgi:hypothetical protein
MVYGGHRRIQADVKPLSADLFQAVGEDPYADLLTGNRIGVHATALHRRDVLLALSGFDEELRRCEDYDLYLRLALGYPIASHPEIVAKYRWHGGNVSKDRGDAAEFLLFSIGIAAKPKRIVRPGIQGSVIGKIGMKPGS